MSESTSRKGAILLAALIAAATFMPSPSDAETDTMTPQQKMQAQQRVINRAKDEPLDVKKAWDTRGTTKALDVKKAQDARGTTKALDQSGVDQVKTQRTTSDFERAEATKRRILNQQTSNPCKNCR